MPFSSSVLHALGSVRRGVTGARRIGLAALIVMVSVMGSFLIQGTASATPTLTVSPTSTLLVTPNSTTTLSGLSISGDTTDTLQATLATTLGTLSITTTTGLTLGYNNSWTGTQSVTFTGLESAINTALASAELVTGATTGTAQVGLTAMVAQTGYYYLASNQHFYEYVTCAGCSWWTADSGAQALSFDGQPGYLVSIPNATVNTFVSTKIANAENVWIGARSYESLATDGTQVYAVVNGVTYARVWRWTEGADESPIAGTVISECGNQTNTCDFDNFSSFYSSWNTGEPNNSGGSTTVAYQGEYTAVTNWNGSSGEWNDLNPTNDANVSGYVVEFGGKTNNNASLGTGFAGVVTTTSNVQVAAAASVPSAPSITATAGNASADVSWTQPASNGAIITSYDVSTDGGVTWNAVSTSSSSSVVNGNTVTTISADVTGLTNGSTYGIEVIAINSAGASAASNEVSVTPATVPGAPTIGTATAGNQQATVTWSAPANNGSTITGYTVTASPGGQTCTWTTGPLSCTVTGLTNGTAYTFTVTATNGVGTGSASAASNSVTPATVPGAPTIGTATAGNAQATVTWSAPANNGSTITGYTVTASPGGQACTWTTGPLSCTVTGLTNGTAYTFTVTATNGVGTGSPSSSSNSVTPATVPSAPSGAHATAGNDEATVSWTAPASNGSIIFGYTVTSSPGGHTCTWTTGPLSCTVTGLTNGTAYTFTVTATNGVGTGSASASSNSVTPATVPGAPTIGTATAGNAQATVTWSAPADNGSTVTGYTVTASPGGQTCTWTSGPLDCTVTGLTNGTTYTFTVTATNGVGTGPTSVPSNSVVPAAVPDAPTGVTASGGDSQATISWTAPASNGSTITGYTVTASPGGQTCTWTSGPLDCTVTGLTNGTAYTFTVTATNGVGTGPTSVPSNSVTPGPAALDIALTLTQTGLPQAETFLVSGSGLEPGSTVTITVHSTPVVLAVVTVADDGTFTTSVTLPSDLPAGNHTVIATGTSALGEPVTSSEQFVAAGTPSAPASQDPPPSTPQDPTLPFTGIDLSLLLEIGLLSSLLGVGLVVIHRRRSTCP